MSSRRLARGRESFADLPLPPVVPSERPRGPSPCPCPCPTYFRRAQPLWMALIAAGMGYYSWTVFSPATIPYGALGPLGTFTKNLVENHRACLYVGYGIAWLIHVIETLYALKLCWDKGITDGPTQLRWTVQTFLFGIASLSHLLYYDPPKETKRQ